MRTTLWLLAVVPLLAFGAPGNHQPFELVRVAVDAAGGGDGAISPDGARIAISSRRSGSWNLWSFDIAARRWTQLTTGAGEDFEAQWSPDSTRLVFASTRAGNKDIWLLTLATGAAVQLTDSPDDDEYPAWSPDGEWIVYTGGPWKQRDFIVMRPDGTERRAVTRSSGQAGACSFAGNDALVCHRYDSGSGDLVRLTLGGDELPLTTGTAWDYKPTTSPDQRWVTFSRGGETPSALWALPLAGGAPRQLTKVGSDDRWPTWSRDGRRLMFHRTVERSQGLRLFDRARGALETLVPAGDAPLAGALDAEARRLVYCSEAGGTRHLRVLDLAKKETRTVDLGSPACFPRWSPDGQQLAFVLWRGDQWQVATAAADGSGLRVWTDGMPGLRGMNGPIDWSPDGKRLVFKSETRAFESDLFVLELESGGIRNVTRDAWFDEAPSFSSDGKAVIFMSTRGGNWTWGLFRLSLQDERVEPITKADYEEKNYPRMGPGGEVVWTTVDARGVEWLAEQDPAGAVRVLRAAGAGARWATYSPDGQKLLFPLLEKAVEYWIVEQPLGAGSPLAEAAPPGPAAPAPTRASPVDKHRR